MAHERNPNMSTPVQTGGLRSYSPTELFFLTRLSWLIRQRRELPSEAPEPPDTAPGPDETLEQHAMREWVWQALGMLPTDERMTVMLRYFSRCATTTRSPGLPGCPSEPCAAGSTAARWAPGDRP